MGSSQSRINAERELAHALANKISSRKATIRGLRDCNLPSGTRKLLFDENGVYIGYKLLVLEPSRIVIFNKDGIQN